MFFIQAVVKGAWTRDEDETLVFVIETYGQTHWAEIARKLGSRSGKQCRERWINHLDPDILKTDFTPEEDIKIVKGVRKLGNRLVSVSFHWINP